MDIAPDVMSGSASVKQMVDDHPGHHQHNQRSSRALPPSPPQQQHAPVRTSRTAKLVGADVREMIAGAYRGEIRSMIRWRDIWKRAGDSCEAIAKGLTGISAVLAFASSSVRDTTKADILSFTSGTVGTVGLVLLTYANYAVRESRQRTSEINGMLASIGVTPLPDIAPLESAEG